MSFRDDIQKALEEAARAGSKELVLKQAELARASMGARGSEITFLWTPPPGNEIDQLGSLDILGPDDRIIEEFRDLLKRQMEVS